MSNTELTNKAVKTRKDRRCDWCGEAISKGDSVRYRTGVTDGDWWSCYEHEECYDALMRTDNMEDGYFEYDQLRGVAMQDDPR